MGRFKERDWVVPDHLPELLREQAYQPIPPDDEDRAFLHAAGLLRTVGGALQTVPVRVEVEQDRFITVGYRFRWTLFAPAQHLPKKQELSEVDRLRMRYAEIENSLDLAESPDQRLVAEADRVRDRLHELGVDVLAEELNPEPVEA